MKPALEKEINELSVAEKARLVDHLLAQIGQATVNEPIPLEILDELDRRAAAFDANPDSGFTIHEVEKSLFPKG